MNTRNTVVRSMHDIGLAVWSGGSLMGAVGLNGAASDVTERAKAASAGWARWAPANAAAIGAHLIGGVGLILANRKRLAHQGGGRTNTIVKSTLTGIALASTVFSGVKGAQVAAAGKVPAERATVPTSVTPPDVASALQQLRLPNGPPPRSRPCSSCSVPNRANNNAPDRSCATSATDPAPRPRRRPWNHHGPPRTHRGVRPSDGGTGRGDRRCRRRLAVDVPARMNRPRPRSGKAK